MFLELIFKRGQDMTGLVSFHTAQNVGTYSCLLTDAHKMKKKRYPLLIVYKVYSVMEKIRCSLIRSQPLTSY